MKIAHCQLPIANCSRTAKSSNLLAASQTSAAILVFILNAFLLCSTSLAAPAAKDKAKKAKSEAPKLVFPPALPDGKTVVTDRSDDFLRAPSTLRSDVVIAKTPPTVDFLFYPGQDYAGKPWSAWGDSLAVGDKYYASIGDHLSPAGNGRVFEYDPAAKQFRLLLDLKKLLAMPEGHYSPAKIHSRLDLGSDGWLYCATHRGSAGTTTDQYHYEGDWIVRANPATGQAEVVARGVVPKHCIPCSVLDGERMIFYGSTAAGADAADQRIQFFAYDLKARKMLYTCPNGPGRYMILARSTGRVYFMAGEPAGGPLLRFDPAQPGPPVEVAPRFGLRAATQETPDSPRGAGGMVYAISQTKGGPSVIWSLNTKTEKVEELGPAGVGTAEYTTSIDADPAGRYLYYTPGAHGGSEIDGTPIVQFDVRTHQRKVIAFLHPFYQAHYGCTLKGTFSAALDAKGETYFVTWNTSRGSKAWDCCSLTAVHIPASER